MNRRIIQKIVLCFALVALCALAIASIRVEPAEAGLSAPQDCPALCPAGFGGSYIGTCDRYVMGCHEVCKVYQNTSGTKCAKDCYAL